MKPTLMPSAWGIVRRTPKLTPEASSMVLFGPGVMEETKANRTNALSRSSEASMAAVSGFSDYRNATVAEAYTWRPPLVLPDTTEACPTYPAQGSPIMPVTIRPAVLADAAQILAFITELADYERARHEVVATLADIKHSLFDAGSTLLHLAGAQRYLPRGSLRHPAATR
ncbi:hypothetical protein WR25_07958 [Diploscapter pachys]|uniref:N-acetyltransferase domain-containing protein n=1 Tax=Diploscapter pachys TaxID=2018661 RepID=A0A2A2M493_9BILA|nr:hypothetical protein WR25_07958 [Diploscapter pachys]